MSADPIVPFRGGFPAKSSHGRQGGTGFFSFLKRFIVPLAKKVLPHVVSGVKDVVKGEAPLEVLKKRGAAAVNDVVDGITQQPARYQPPTKRRRKTQKGKGKKKPATKKKTQRKKV